MQRVQDQLGFNIDAIDDAELRRKFERELNPERLLDLSPKKPKKPKAKLLSKASSVTKNQAKRLRKKQRA